jgi:hypothetical protein
MLNAFVGWFQEKQAGDIVEKLKAGIAAGATVRSQSLGITTFLVRRFHVLGRSWRQRAANRRP